MSFRIMEKMLKVVTDGASELCLNNSTNMLHPNEFLSPREEKERSSTGSN